MAGKESLPNIWEAIEAATGKRVYLVGLYDADTRMFRVRYDDWRAIKDVWGFYGEFRLTEDHDKAQRMARKLYGYSKTREAVEGLGPGGAYRSVFEERDV